MNAKVLYWFCLQKFLLVLLSKSLIISCVVSNLRSSNLKNSNKIENSSNKKIEKVQNVSEETYSLLEKKSAIKSTPVKKLNKF